MLVHVSSTKLSRSFYWCLISYNCLQTNVEQAYIEIFSSNFKTFSKLLPQIYVVVSLAKLYMPTFLGRRTNHSSNAENKGPRTDI